MNAALDWIARRRRPWVAFWVVGAVLLYLQPSVWAFVGGATVAVGFAMRADWRRIDAEIAAEVAKADVRRRTFIHVDSGALVVIESTVDLVIATPSFVEVEG